MNTPIVPIVPPVEGAIPIPKKQQTPKPKSPSAARDKWASHGAAKMKESDMIKARNKDRGGLVGLDAVAPKIHAVVALQNAKPAPRQEPPAKMTPADPQNVQFVAVGHVSDQTLVDIEIPTVPGEMRASEMPSEKMGPTLTETVEVFEGRSYSY